MPQGLIPKNVPEKEDKIVFASQLISNFNYIELVPVFASI